MATRGSCAKNGKTSRRRRNNTLLLFLAHLGQGDIDRASISLLKTVGGINSWAAVDDKWQDNKITTCWQSMSLVRTNSLFLPPPQVDVWHEWHVFPTTLLTNNHHDWPTSSSSISQTIFPYNNPFILSLDLETIWKTIAMEMSGDTNTRVTSVAYFLATFWFSSFDIGRHL